MDRIVRAEESWSERNPGQVGLGSSRPESTRPGQVGLIHICGSYPRPSSEPTSTRIAYIYPCNVLIYFTAVERQFSDGHKFQSFIFLSIECCHFLERI